MKTKNIMNGGGCSTSDNTIVNIWKKLFGKDENDDGIDLVHPGFKMFGELCIFISIMPLIPLFYILVIGLSMIKYLFSKIITI